ncbi:hypothetical protein [Paenibacillus cremeus]|nr:hypothetical protein [Paenibacillus cremeus]
MFNLKPMYQLAALSGLVFYLIVRLVVAKLELNTNVVESNESYL